MSNISPEEAQKIIEGGKAVVIDVRTPAEFEEGHIPGAQNIDIYDTAFEEKIEMLSPDITYVVNCRSGGRSASACSAMEEFGFTDARNLEGGIIAWEKAGLKTEK